MTVSERGTRPLPAPLLLGDDPLRQIARREVRVARHAIDQQDVLAPAIRVADVGAAAAGQRDHLLAERAPGAGREAVRSAVVPDDFFAPGLEIEEDEAALPEVAERAVYAALEEAGQLDQAGGNSGGLFRLLRCDGDRWLGRIAEAEDERPL